MKSSRFLLAAVFGHAMAAVDIAAPPKARLNADFERGLGGAEAKKAVLVSAETATVGAPQYNGPLATLKKAEGLVAANKSIDVPVQGKKQSAANKVRRH